MKITKPVITQVRPGLWRCEVPLPRLYLQFNAAYGHTMMDAYRNWVAQAANRPFEYGIGGLDVAYHREQVQRMEANVGFRDAVENHNGIAVEDDEDESTYLDDRLDSMSLFHPEYRTRQLLDSQADTVSFAGLYLQDWHSGCGAPPGHLDREIASLQGQGLLPPPAPIEMRD